MKTGSLPAIMVLVVAFAAISGQANTDARQTATARAEGILRQMTLEGKIDHIGGHETFYIRPMKRLSLPAIKMADGRHSADREGDVARAAFIEASSPPTGGG